MNYQIKSGNVQTLRTGCVVVGVFESNRLSAAAQQLDSASGGTIARILRRGDMEGKTGQTLMLYDLPNVRSERVLLTGCGKQREFDDDAYRKALEATATSLQTSGATDACSCLAELPVGKRNTSWKIRQAVVSTEAKLYTFDQTKSVRKAPSHPLKKLTLIISNGSVTKKEQQAIHEGSAIAAGMSLTRDLANLPGNICTPSYLAEQAKAIKKGKRAVKVKIIDEPEMEKLGMGALLSVSRGSEQPAKLITLEYRGTDAKTKPIVLVGKGITFDTGGISIKPSEAMDEMKYDMAGAASVLGTIKACAQMELSVNAVGIVASAENMPGGRASKPGDIVTTMSGKTVEILNTDAEGRLVLCDALTYAKRFEPAVVIDIATLTGAVIIALGNHPSGLMGNDEKLVQDLIDAGNKSGDLVWQLPLWKQYQEQLESNFADIANIGGRPAGAVTAACFLSHFTTDYRWAHLDIAGTAWRSGKDKGASGRPVPLLMDYLLKQVKH